MSTRGNVNQANVAIYEGNTGYAFVTDLTINDRFIQDHTGDQDKCKEKSSAMKAGMTLLRGCLWRCHWKAIARGRLLVESSN